MQLNSTIPNPAVSNSTTSEPVLTPAANGNTSSANGSAGNGNLGHRIRNGSRNAIPANHGPNGEQLLERAILLVSDLRKLGIHRKVSNSQVEVDADRETIFVHKRLLDAPELKAIFTHDSSIRSYINAHCLPSYFRAGVALLPIVSVEEVDARLEELRSQRETLVDAFVAVYPGLVQAAQARLRGLFDPRDYPSPDVVRASFTFQWRYATLGVPTTLAAIDRELFRREREKFAAQMNEAALNIQTLLRAHMAQLVSHMQERLTPGPDGQPKVFRNSMVSNFTEFLKTFEARNIVDDSELAAVVARARDLLQDVDPATLRRSEDLRETVRSGFETMARQLDRLVTNRPARRIVLDRPPQVERLTTSEPQKSEAPSNEQPVRAVDADSAAQDEERVGGEHLNGAVPDATAARADADVPLAVRTTGEFRLFAAARQEAGLPWQSSEHAESFAAAYQAAAGSLAGLEELTPLDYAAAAQLVRSGELRW